MPDPTAPTNPQPAPVPPAAPATRVTDELTPFDLHGPGRCGHTGCWERAEDAP